MKEFTNRITLYIYIAYGNMKKEKTIPHIERQYRFYFVAFSVVRLIQYIRGCNKKKVFFTS